MAAGPVAGLAAGAAKKAVGPLVGKAKSAFGALNKTEVPDKNSTATPAHNSANFAKYKWMRQFWLPPQRIVKSYRISKSVGSNSPKLWAATLQLCH